MQVFRLGVVHIFLIQEFSYDEFGRLDKVWDANDGKVRKNASYGEDSISGFGINTK